MKWEARKAQFRKVNVGSEQTHFEATELAASANFEEIGDRLEVVSPEVELAVDEPDSTAEDPEATLEAILATEDEASSTHKFNVYGYRMEET